MKEMEYNISEAELPTMVVRYENQLILRSVISGKHLKDLGLAPVWDELPPLPFVKAHGERLQAEHDQALEALVKLYPCEEAKLMEPPKMPQWQSQSQSQSQLQLLLQNVSMPQTLMPPAFKPTIPHATPAPSPIVLNETELPPCKVHRNYCCNYCNFCTQNPRTHLLHQRQNHGVQLSIHCCNHCQYASRYFQKLKRHVKMVHMGNSPGKVKAHTTKRVTKPKQNIVAKPVVLQPTARPTPKPETPKQAPVQQAAQKPAAVPPAMPSTSKPPVKIKNPEAFFEAAYRKQLIQQPMLAQHYKEFVRLTSVLKKSTKPVTSKGTLQPLPTNLPQMNHQQSQPIKQQPLKISAPQSNSVVEMPCGRLEVPPEKTRTYGCNKCSYVTSIRSRYNKHVKYHTMPMIQCDKCEFRTTYKWNLTRHLRSHHGNGLYKCSICSFSSDLKQSLTIHEINHHSPPVDHFKRKANKPYRRRRCRVGGSDLVQHMKHPQVATSQTQNLTRTAPIAADNAVLENPAISTDNKTLFMNSAMNLVAREPITADNPMNQDHLKLLLKGDAASTSSYSSSPTHPHLTEINSKKTIYPSSSTSSRSPSPTARVVGLHEEFDRSQQPVNSSMSCQSQPPASFTRTLETDSDTEDTDDDSLSTLSANETVPPGFHIAYDSSSNDSKCNESDSEASSKLSLKFQVNHELDQQKNVHPENVPTF